MILVHILAFLLGLALVSAATISAIRTLVLPRSARDLLTTLVFRFWRWIFDFRLRNVQSYEERDSVMAFYAPVALLTLLPMWLLLVTLGFAAMFWGTGVGTWEEALTISGSSLLTLGFAKSDSPLHIGMDFAEAALGLILIALLIAYLPIMYSAFSRRELAVTMLEVRAGSPPSAIEMISRYHRLNRLNLLHDIWESWEVWFADVEESHTSLAALVFFRSPQAKHSWVTASGAVLDAASLTLAIVDIPHDRQADLCIRAGYLALRHIADFFQVDYNPNPQFPREPISIAREEFDAAYNELETAGVPVRTDREQAWLDFAGWRVNYDRVLISLCRLTMAPYAPWSSDRSLIGG